MTRASSLSRAAGRRGASDRALEGGARFDEIGERLDLREVEPAVEKGAAGEFTGLGGAQARLALERRERAADHRRPAMQMQLGAVLARRGSGRGEVERQTPIERLAAFGIPQVRRQLKRGLRLQAREPHERTFGAGPRKADDRDSGAPGAARESKDRVGR